MPRKTRAEHVEGLPPRVASMRPRPDAAENAIADTSKVQAIARLQ